MRFLSIYGRLSQNRQKVNPIYSNPRRFFNFTEFSKYPLIKTFPPVISYWRVVMELRVYYTSSAQCIFTFIPSA